MALRPYQGDPSVSNKISFPSPVYFNEGRGIIGFHSGELIDSVSSG